ncbi:hypothetical protein L6164_000917 [Bauhinia variegata]|nr:hypothetical protein L6164_000917 [Bauhinia variegata]
MKPTNCLLFFGAKREAEDELEKLASAKKQKRDELADKQLNAKKPAVKVPIPSKKQPSPAKKSKPASSSSSDSSDDSSEDEAPKSKVNGPAATKKKGDSIESSDSDDISSGEDNEKMDVDDDDDDDDDSSEESEEETQQKNIKGLNRERKMEGLKSRSVLIVCMVLHLLIASSEAYTLGCITKCGLNVPISLERWSPFVFVVNRGFSPRGSTEPSGYWVRTRPCLTPFEWTIPSVNSPEAKPTVPPLRSGPRFTTVFLLVRLRAMLIMAK